MTELNWIAVEGRPGVWVMVLADYFLGLHCVCEGRWKLAAFVEDREWVELGEFPSLSTVTAAAQLFRQGVNLGIGIAGDCL